MDYIDVQQARQRSGLRLVLCAGTPGVWGEALKAILGFKGLQYQAVAQEVGGDNEALRLWTGQTSAPVLVSNDGRICCTWESQLLLAECLAPEPCLIPQNLPARVQQFGWLREIAGQDGFGWCRRLQSLQASGGPDAHPTLARLAAKYGYSDAALQASELRVCEILEGLEGLLEASAGDYCFGKQITALDFYAAVFTGVMLDPLSVDVIPMPDGMRFGFTAGADALNAAMGPRLRGHRQCMFDQHIDTPLDF